MARKLVAVAFSLGCLHAGSTMALGLGEITLESFLNEPLRASVDLLDMAGLHEEQVKIRLATSEDFDKLGLDRAYFLTNIRFEVVSDGSGARIILTSDEPVLEPYLDFAVEARWPSGRLLREYTVLVDPPAFSQATPVVSASARVEEVEGIAAPAKKNEEVLTSGTRVDVRDSNLAPGAMPQRDYNSTSSTSPTPGSRYMISRDQTLWEIASQARPEGASVHQTMLDIQRLNPDAFINGNINRIKAGYIIYLPSAQDISSADVSSALAEVREQNAAWREGRDAQLYAGSGPSLSISAETEEEPDAASAVSSGTGASAPQVKSESGSPAATAGESVESAPSQSGDVQERLAVLEHQLATLQTIVTLKDDQIAALQNALAEAGGTAPADLGVEVAPGEIIAETPTDVDASPIVESELESLVSDTPPAAQSAEEIAEIDAPEAVPEVEVVDVVEEPAESAKTAVTPTPVAPADNGMMSYLLYILGALVLAVAGFVMFRRRRDSEEMSEPASGINPVEDVFSKVQLKDQTLEVDGTGDDDKKRAAQALRDNRGYGERKNDEYASDVDTADALAEADIYIAYGRHPQAIDLLNSALASEPGNPVYRLKLLEIYTELNDLPGATAQLKKLQDIGDPDSIARAEALMKGLTTGGHKSGQANTDRSRPSGSESSLSPNPFVTKSGSQDDLEAGFSGLEIEGSSKSGDQADELDLTVDFPSARRSGSEDEDLVIAADSNGLSTKLDLARAYLDMGDEDGARQILDEVVAEGSDELKAEARVLLDRIG